MVNALERIMVGPQFPITVERHLRVGGFEAGVVHYRTHQFLEKLAGRAAGGYGFKALINLVAHGDFDFMRRDTTSIRRLAVSVQTGRASNYGVPRAGL